MRVPLPPAVPLAPGHPVVVGHRGAPRLAPENTLAGFRAAAACGVRMIETDVRLSRDGAVVVIHDETPHRTTDATALGVAADSAVEELDLAQLRQLDAGSWFAPAFAGERIPLLSELGVLARDLGVALDLEVKPPSHHAAHDVVAALADQLATGAWPGLVADGAVVVTSFDPVVVEAALAVLPVPVGLLTAALPEPAEIAQLPDLGVAVLVTDQTTLTPAGADPVHRAGLPLWTYTANEPQEWQRLLECGLGAICTDDPAGLRDYLRSARDRSGGASG